jgi:hypothetical protein
VDTLGPHTLWLGMDPVLTLWLGMGPVRTPSLGMDPVHTSRLDIAAVHTSRVDTAAISGTAVGGITALARAGYGRTFTPSTCGPAIKVLQRHFTSLDFVGG